MSTEKAIQKSDYFKVSLSALVVEEGFNVRKDMGDLDVLAKSIATIGQQVPVIATKVRGEDAFKLTAGHRRLAAIKLANEKYGANITQVIVMGASGDEKGRVLTMLLDGEGAKKLTTSELASGFARLKEMGMKPLEIGESIGISQAQVYNILAVNKAPEAIQKMLEKGDISVALINEIQRTTKDAEEQVSLALEAVAKASEEVTATGKKKVATAKNATTSKVSADVAKLEAAIALVDPTLAKVATLKAIINKLKAKASAEDISKLLK
jgi:ParB/RepB/Spo0J family partition protein